MNEVNQQFWSSPPWQGGVRKHRLGLKPIEPSAWLAVAPGDRERNNKEVQLSQRYAEVVQVLPGVQGLDDMLAELPWPGPAASDFPDRIANLAMTVADDLCVIDVMDQQRLVAACLCAPSYWRLLEKIGKPLSQVHAPVPELNNRIGANIARFIANAPLQQPFSRSNWFLHGDALLFHDQPEAVLDVAVEQWTVRSEYQTLCRCTRRYLLFTIRIICEPLQHIRFFPSAQRDLLASLQNLDEHEIAHAGGLAKCRQLTDYVASL